MVITYGCPPGPHSADSFQCLSQAFLNVSFILATLHFRSFSKTADLNCVASVPYSLRSLCLECYALLFPVSFHWSLYFKNLSSEPLSDDVTSGLSFLTLWPKVIPSLPFFRQVSKYLLEPRLVKHFDKMIVYKTVVMYKSIMYCSYYITSLVTNHIHPVFLIAFKGINYIWTYPVTDILTHRSCLVCIY